MGIIFIDKSRCDSCGACISACPFSAMEAVGEYIEINSACKICGACIKACPLKCIKREEERRPIKNLDEWAGILVFAEYNAGRIHPVSFELIGKALELGEKIKKPVYSILIGDGIIDKKQDLEGYGLKKVFLYDNQEFCFFRADVYANAFEDCINRLKPSIVLIGATAVGRSLAPRVSTRFRTGLTADCTFLDVRGKSDLVQIRPAFGGNIMAQIATKKTRPQFATVRYKAMERSIRTDNKNTIFEFCQIPSDKLLSRIHPIGIEYKKASDDISEAEILIVGGRGLRSSKDFDLLGKIAGLLGGQLAATRPLVEAGWASYTNQIGLSGRTVKPKLIITCGVSGAIQFAAGMSMSNNIIAINSDRNAPIFKIAHYGIIGDLYEIIPELIKRIERERQDVL